MLSNQLFGADPTKYRNSRLFLLIKKLKKDTSSKVGYFSIIEENFISALAIKTVKFMFSNLACRANV
jgi:hypothetical protein